MREGSEYERQGRIRGTLGGQRNAAYPRATRCRRSATPANAADSTVLPDLLHGKETRVWGDQAYRGQRAVIRQHAPKAQDFTNRRYRHRGVVDEIERARNRTKSKIRARVEHAIGVIKRVFGFAKVRYRGLNKNTHRLLVTCALANLFMARRHLLRGATATA